MGLALAMRRGPVSRFLAGALVGGSAAGSDKGKLSDSAGGKVGDGVCGGTLCDGSEEEVEGDDQVSGGDGGAVRRCDLGNDDSDERRGDEWRSETVTGFGDAIAMNKGLQRIRMPCAIGSDKSVDAGNAGADCCLVEECCGVEDWPVACILGIGRPHRSVS